MSLKEQGSLWTQSQSQADSLWTSVVGAVLRFLFVKTLILVSA